MDRLQVFLSHSHADQAEAITFAQQLRKYFRSNGCSIEVFNTSEPQYRFEALENRIQSGVCLPAEIEKWETELRDYLRTNIENAFAYILFVTPTSLAKDSSVIHFEMLVANGVASGQRFFFPCTKGVSLERLPKEAVHFRGVDLDEQGGFMKLAHALDQLLAESKGRTKI